MTHKLGGDVNVTSPQESTQFTGRRTPAGAAKDGRTVPASPPQLLPSFDTLANGLIAAVAVRDSVSVAECLNQLDRHDLEGLAILLASRLEPIETNAEKATEAARRAAEVFGTTVGAVLSRSGCREDVDARTAAMYACRLLGMAYSETGRYFDRDHSTVMYACSRAGETPRLRKAAQRIAAELGWDREDAA